MTYGLIFSAGNETRFDDLKPKALSMIDGQCLLDINIQNLKTICDKVYVVVSNANKHFFNNYNTIIIESGKGCGDAVMKVLRTIHFNKDDMCVISWGDCVIQNDVLRNMVNSFKKGLDIIVPCAFENDPYVSLSKSHGYINVKFKKYGETCICGYHDFGMFYGVCSNIQKHLEVFSQKITFGNGYKHKHGNEMQFLDVFNETDIYGDLIEITNNVPLSFNTKKELNEIKL